VVITEKVRRPSDCSARIRLATCSTASSAKPNCTCHGSRAVALRGAVPPSCPAPLPLGHSAASPRHRLSRPLAPQGLSDLAAHYLTKAGVSAIRRLRKTDNNRIARACGATIVNR
jgi:hypothetical protein